MTTARALVTSVACAASVACATPLGMYGHRPVDLWQSKTEAAELKLAKTSYVGAPIVIKRFENRAQNPVGFHFSEDTPSSGAVAQAYAPAVDLAAPLFESTYAALIRAEFPVWKALRTHN